MAKITLSHFPPEHNLPVREKEFIGTTSILAWVKVVVAYTIKFFTRNSHGENMYLGFLLLAINIPLQFTNDKNNDSSMREGIPLDALIWFGRGYKLHTPKSVSREGSKAWVFSVVSHFSLSPLCAAFFSHEVIFTRARVSLALLSLRKNGGLLIVYLLMTCLWI